METTKYIGLFREFNKEMINYIENLKKRGFKRCTVVFDGILWHVTNEREDKL